MIAEDDFNRADNTALGAKWVEVTGDSEIVDQQLEMPASGIIRTVSSHPVNSPTGHVRVDLEDIVAGDDFMALINYNPTTGNYLYGRYYWDGGLTVDISVGDQSGEWDTTTTAIPAATGEPPTRSDRLLVCRSRDGLYANAQSDYPAAWKCQVSDNGGRYAGLKANAVGGTELTFDNFEFEEHYATNHDCPACSCECEEFCVPKQMEITFIVISCDCGAINTGVRSTVVNRMGSREYSFTFVDSLPYDILPTPSSCTSVGTFEFLLTCNPSGRTVQEQWELSHLAWIPSVDHQPTTYGWEELNPESGGVAHPNPDSTCSPLYLEFGGFLILGEGDVECSYYVTVEPVYS